MDGIEHGKTLYDMMNTNEVLKCYISENWAKCNKALSIQAGRSAYIDRQQVGEFRITFPGRKVSAFQIPDDDADDENSPSKPTWKNIFKGGHFRSIFDDKEKHNEGHSDDDSSSSSSDDDSPAVIDRVDEKERERIRQAALLTQASLQDDDDGTSSSHEHMTESEPVTLVNRGLLVHLFTMINSHS